MDALSLALAEGSHELLELGVALDLEEDFVVIVRHLDIEMLDRGRLRGIAWGAAVLSIVRHDFVFVEVVSLGGKQAMLCAIRGKSAVGVVSCVSWEKCETKKATTRG